MEYVRVLAFGRTVAVVVCSLLIAACSSGSNNTSSADSATAAGPGTGTASGRGTSNEPLLREDPPPPPPVDGSVTPTADLSVSQTEVDLGGSVQLSWSSTGATSCQASGAWSGSVGVSGSQSVGPLDQSSTFTLRCSGESGEAVSMIAVEVLGTFVVEWQAPELNEDGTPLTDLAEYRLFIGETSGDYTATVAVGSPNSTTRTVKAPLGNYFVAMKSINADGVESTFSNEVVRTSS